MNSIPLSEDPEFAECLEVTQQKFPAPSPEAARRMASVLETDEKKDAGGQKDDDTAS